MFQLSHWKANITFFYRYIIDSGFVKQLNHNSRVGMDILEVVPISKWVVPNVQLFQTCI